MTDWVGRPEALERDWVGRPEALERVQQQSTEELE